MARAVRTMASGLTSAASWAYTVACSSVSRPAPSPS